MEKRPEYIEQGFRFPFHRAEPGERPADLRMALSVMIGFYGMPYFWRDYTAGPVADNHHWELGFDERRAGYWSRAVVLASDTIQIEDAEFLVVDTFTAHNGRWIPLEFPRWRIPLWELWFTGTSAQTDTLATREREDTPQVQDVVPKSEHISHEMRNAVTHPQGDSTAPEFAMKRRALVAKHKHHWPTIEGDISAASTNGLNRAKAGLTGWREPYVLAWALANGRITDAPAHGIDTLTRLPTRKHWLGK